jgi:hypothetical protein
VTAAAASCIGEPVSWLRLEQLALGELAAPAAATVRDHLAACPACTACMQAIAEDVVALPALPALPAAEPARVPWWRRRVMWSIGAAVAAAAAVILVLVLRPRGVEHEVHGVGITQSVRLKGGDVLEVGLVRERAGATVMQPTAYAAGDRFKVIVTCSQAIDVWADVMVLQPDPAQPGAPMVAAYPFDPVRVACGNHVPVPGAFRITGGGPASVCLAVEVDHPPTRDPLGRRREGIACYQLIEDRAGDR